MRHGVRQHNLILLAALVVATTATGRAQELPVKAPEAAVRASATQQRGQTLLSAMPLIFEKNQGQADGAVDFMSHGDGRALALSPAGASFTFAEEHTTVSKLQMHLLGANASAPITGVDQVPGITNYLYGKDASKWITKVPNFQKVMVTGALPGIDVVYYGNHRQLEYDFDLAPAADPDSITLRFDGSKSLHLDADGSLIVATEAGDVRLENPHAFQEDPSGTRAAVAAKFVLAENGEVRFALGAYDRTRALVIDPTIQYSTFWGGVLTFGPNYISHEPVILGMGVDAAGAAYIYGIDESQQEQLTTPSVTLGGGCPATCVNIFVTKFDPSKSGAASLVYTTIIPAFDVQESDGSNGAGLYNGLSLFPSQALAVDAAGNAFFTGGTDNPDYPTTSTAFQTTCNINPQATDPTGKFCVPTGYVTELSPDGSTILYSTLIGSLTKPVKATASTYFEYPSWGTSLAVDSAHVVYMGAYGYNGFPNTSAYGCNTIVFGVPYCSSGWAVRLDTTKSGNSALIFSAPFYANDMVVATDGAGNLYWSTHGCDFTAYEAPLGNTPITYNGYLTVTSPTGNCSTLHKMDSTGAIVYATYMYGSSTTALGDGEYLIGIAADPDGRAYLAGLTEDVTWPNVNGLPNPASASISDEQGWPYLSVFDTTQTGTASLVYSTILDGASTVGSGLAAFGTNGCGSATLVGGSSDAAYPLVNPLPGTGEPTTYYQGESIYAAVIDTKLAGQSSLTFSTAIPGGEIANYAVLNQLGNLYIAAGAFGGGWTAGSTRGLQPAEDVNDFPITSNAYQSIPTQGGTPGFFVRNSGIPNPDFMTISQAIPPGCYTVSPNPLAFGNQLINTASASQPVVFTNTASVPVTFSSITPSAGYTETDNCGTQIAKNASCTVNVTFEPTSTGAQNGTLTFTDTDVTATQVINLTGTGTSPSSPIASLSPTPYAFANQTANTTSAPQMFVLSNTGTAALAISGITLTGANPSDFAISSNLCPASLAQNATCNIFVTFTPASATSFSAMLSVADNAAGSPHVALLSGTGTPAVPVATLSPGTSFGNQPEGTTSAAQAFTLSNTGTATLNISSIAIGGVNPTSFALTSAGTCGSTLAQNATCTIDVTFSPAAPTAYAATLTVTDNATGSPHTAALTGTGTYVKPTVTLLPSPVSFGNVTQGAKSPAQTVTLTNTGTSPFTLTSYGPADTTDFAATSTCGSTLAPGNNCTFSVTFTPASVGNLTTTLSVVDAADSVTATATLNGAGTTPPAPVAGLAPNPVAFPATTVNTASAAIPVTLSNTGNASLTISSVALTGANPTDFSFANGCGSTLAANSTCTIMVSFTPASVASFSATLSVATNAAGSPQTVTLSGSGTAPPAPIAGLAPNPVAFPATTINTPATAIPVTLSNTGNAPLTISGVTLTGANPNDFSLADGCGSTLAAGTTCTITVNFTPASVASFSATLSVATNAAGSPQTTAITGSGIAPTDFSVTAATPTQTVESGGVAQFSINVAALSGNYNLPVVLSVSGVPAGSTAGFSPPSVVPGSSGASTVLFVQTPSLTAALAPHPADSASNHAAWFATLLLLPLLRSRLRRKFLRLSKPARLLFALLALGSLLPLSGCGGGYFGHAPQTVTLTVTGTSGSLQHSTTVTLTIQ